MKRKFVWVKTMSEETVALNVDQIIAVWPDGAKCMVNVADGDTYHLPITAEQFVSDCMRP